MKKRKSFVSNSSSSSYIVDYDTFQKWIDKGNIFQLEKKYLYLHDHIVKSTSELMPYMPYNMYEKEITEDDFEIIENEEFYKIYMKGNYDLDIKRTLIVKSLKKYIPFLIHLFNDLVEYCRIEKNGKESKKHEDCHRLYINLCENYALDLSILLLRNLKNIALIEFRGYDDSPSNEAIKKDYGNDESYVRAVAYELASDYNFWRVYNEH